MKLYCSACQHQSIPSSQIYAFMIGRSPLGPLLVKSANQPHRYWQSQTTGVLQGPHFAYHNSCASPVLLYNCFFSQLEPAFCVMLDIVTQMPAAPRRLLHFSAQEPLLLR